MGETYACYAGPDDPCVVVQLGRDHRGRPAAEVEDGNGYLSWVPTRYLQPWHEFLSEQELEFSRQQDMVFLARRLTGGVGRVWVEPAYARVYHLRFSEDAAGALLLRLGSKPLSDDCRPSKAETHGELRDARLSLARRIRRALGVGCASAWAMQRLDYTGSDCQIEISYHALFEAVRRLDPAGSKSSLSELIS